MLVGSPSTFEYSTEPNTDAAASEAVVAQEENQDQNLDRVKDGLRNILLRSSRPTANR
jgi:hypothetical protein